MPTMVTETVEPLVDTSVGPLRKTWTREEVAALAKSGELNVERLGFVEGELIGKLGKSRPLIIVQNQIAKILNDVFGIDRVTLNARLEVAYSDSLSNEPVPILLATHRKVRFYKTTPLR